MDKKNVFPDTFENNNNNNNNRAVDAIFECLGHFKTIYTE